MRRPSLTLVVLWGARSSADQLLKLPKRLSNCFLEAGLVAGGERSELSDNEPLFQRGKDRFDRRGFE